MITLAVLVVAPTFASAQNELDVPCLIYEPMRPRAAWLRVDEPIEVQADGSFSKTADDDERQSGIYGGPVVDVGEGIVAQKLTVPWASCGPAEQLLVVDCRSSESVIFDGLVDPSFTVSNPVRPRATISMLQPPHGPIALRPGVRVDELVALAQANGIDADLNVAAQVEELAPHNRWDPLFGCSLFYPDYSGQMNPS